MKRRKRETDIATFLHERVMDYIKGCLASEAFGDSCRKEALRNRAKGAGVAARTAQHSSLPSGQH